MLLLTINIFVLGLVLHLGVKNQLVKKQSVRIIKAGQYIKPFLVECALCDIKDKSCPYIKSRYESIKIRQGHKKAIITIARFLLTSLITSLMIKYLLIVIDLMNFLKKN